MDFRPTSRRSLATYLWTFFVVVGIGTSIVIIEFSPFFVISGLCLALAEAGFALIRKRHTLWQNRQHTALPYDQFSALQDQIAQLRQDREMLQIIAESATIRVFWKDRDLRYLGCNSLFAQDAGFSNPKDLVGKTDFDLHWHAHATLYQANDQRIMATDQAKYRITEPLRTHSGKSLLITISKIPLHNANGEVVGIVGIYEDHTNLTERLYAEELISIQRDLARMIPTITSIDDVWPRCFESARRIAEIDSGGIYLFDETQQHLNLVYHCGLNAEFVRQAQQYHRDAPNVQALLASEKLYWNQRELQRYPWASAETLKSIFVVPLEYHGQILGCINFASHSMSEIPEVTQQALSAIATEIGNIVVHLQTVSALREREEHYRVLMESLDSLVATVDAEGRLRYLNRGTLTYLGGTAQDFLGKSLEEIFPSDETTSYQNLIRFVISEAKTIEFETQSTRRSDPLWRRVVISPIRNAHGQVSLALIHATNIHELKTIQQELLELNQTLEQRVVQRSAEVQNLYEYAPVGYHSIDADMRITRVNQTELDMFGYTREELLGAPIAKLISPNHHAKIATCFAQLKSVGQVRDLEIEFVRKDGSHFIGSVNATAVTDASGTFVMSRSSLIDISARKQAEQALRESEAQNRLLFEETPDAVVLFDHAGVVMQANRAFAQLTGIASKHAIHGYSLEDLGLPDWRKVTHSTQPSTAAPAPSPPEAELQLHCRDGEVRAVTMKTFAVKIDQQQCTLATLHDITAEKAAEALLRQANRELARAAQAKDEFLANMSHELRTPLNAILAYSESLQEGIFGQLNEQQQTRIQHIESSGKHLLALINDILDLAKVEAGHTELDLRPCAIHKICEESLLFVRELTHKKAQHLRFSSNDIGAQMLADPKRLKQMLVNLLSNAVKFTPSHGQISLEVRVDHAAQQVMFAVRDTGEGIAPEHLNRLFQPFSQIDSSLNRQYEGTGLGLALVRRFAELHGGSTSVESAINEGSCFTITLPYHPIPQVAAPPDNLPPQLSEETGLPRHHYILLVEDNVHNITATVDYLTFKQFKVDVVHNGREALAYLQDHQPDLIITDIQMPDIDGLTLIQMLREMPSYAQTPIIALTALAMPGDRERCLAAGANSYLMKPVHLRDLVAIMHQHLRR